MTLRILLSITTFIGLLAAGTSYGNSIEFIDGTARLSDRLPDGTPIKIVISTTKYSSRMPYKGGFFGWGAELTPPQSIVTGMDVRIGKEKVFVPLSAYSDLGNPKQSSLEKTQSSFLLTIRGGDASVAYEAVLVFENGYIRRRKVSHREFPDVAWEETVYSFNTGAR